MIIGITSVRGGLLRGVLGLLLTVGVVVAVRATGPSVARIEAQDGAAWLVSSSVGRDSLVDGASGQIVAQVKVVRNRAVLTSAQHGADAYVDDAVSGTVLRVDGATLTASQGVVVTAPGRRGAVFPGPGAVYLVSQAERAVTVLDPVSLRPRGPRWSLAAPVPAGTSLVDRAGRFWVLDRAARTLVRVDQHGVRRQWPVAASETSQLVLAAGKIVWVDPARGVAGMVDGDGRPRGSACLDTAGDDSMLFAPAVTAGRVVAVSPKRRSVLVLDVPSGDCRAALTTLPASSGDFGTPQVLAGRLFVPDYGAGEVHVVDLRTSTVVASPRVLPHGRRFELHPQGQFVFYNDPTSEEAGVIRLDGSVRPVRKYNPANPDNSLPSPSPQPTSGGPSESPPPPGPRVWIGLSRSSVPAGTPVGLQIESAGGADVRGARWDLGDGSSVDGLRTQHSWAAPGDYTVNATTTLADGTIVTPTATIHVTAMPSPPPSPPGSVEISATLQMNPPASESDCPATLRAEGSITSTGPATVTYQIENTPADRPARTLVFPAAGTQAISASWRVETTAVSEQAVLHILTPVDVQSAPAPWAVACPAAAPVTVRNRALAGSAVRVVSDRPGIDCPAAQTCRADFLPGPEITLTASGPPGWTLQFSGACSSNPCRLTVPATKAGADVTLDATAPVDTTPPHVAVTAAGVTTDEASGDAAGHSALPFAISASASDPESRVLRTKIWAFSNFTCEASDGTQQDGSTGPTLLAEGVDSASHELEVACPAAFPTLVDYTVDVWGVAVSDAPSDNHSTAGTIRVTPPAAA